MELSLLVETGPLTVTLAHLAVGVVVLKWILPKTTAIVFRQQLGIQTGMGRIITARLKPATLGILIVMLRRHGMQTAPN